jgi:hypothetical protein
MQATEPNKYALQDLHQAIDLIDRKIIYCQSSENFETQEARDTNLRKLATKRATLVKAATALTSQGFKCDPRFLPRSFIHPVEAAEESLVPAVAEGGGAVVRKRRTRR